MLYREPFVMVPNFKLIVVCNKRPNLDVYDGALKRRIKLIPFPNVIPRDQRDHRLSERLKGEASGILNWMIEGAKAYFAKNIRVPQAVRDATSGYFVDKDSVQSFLAEETVKDQRAKVAKGDLHASYLAYCKAELVDAVGKREFGTIIKK